MVTPFDSHGAVNEGAARRLMRHLVDHGSDGVVIAGTTGESATLDDEEKLRLFEAAVDELGERATVVAGTGSNDTAHSVRLTAAGCGARRRRGAGRDPLLQQAERARAARALQACAEAAGDVPMLLYNIPARSVINLEPDLLIELSKDRQHRGRQAGERGHGRGAADRRGARTSRCTPATTTSCARSPRSAAPAASPCRRTSRASA